MGRFEPVDQSSLVDSAGFEGETTGGLGTGTITTVPWEPAELPGAVCELSPGLIAIPAGVPPGASRGLNAPPFAPTPRFAATAFIFWAAPGASAVAH